MAGGSHLLRASPRFTSRLPPSHPTHPVTYLNLPTFQLDSSDAFLSCNILQTTHQYTSTFIEAFPISSNHNHTRHPIPSSILRSSSQHADLRQDPHRQDHHPRG